MSFEVDKVYNGFKLKEEREVKDINSICRLFEHEKTGARLLYVSNDDENKVFSIAFRTPPEDDTGLPHILEHSVLCGSRKFPVKEPFVELLKSSQNTFLNAMTFPDKTIYPVASMNHKDFLNLMDVYLDSVFYPNIYNKKEIFMQEGWHYELNDKKDDLTYKGVVYNEMKGYYSSPENIMFMNSMNSLFPDTCYRHDSGGKPEKIVTLSLDKFLNFHSKYYHPSNSYIYLYGDGNVLEHLKFINDEYLKDFDRKEIDSRIRLQTGFEEQRQYEFEYPIGAEEDEKFRSYFALAFVCINTLNRELSVAFEILGDVLMANTSSPLKKILLETGLANDFALGASDDPILQPMFGVFAFEADYKEKDKFVKIVYETLKELSEKGIDLELIEGAINKKEFALKEANAGRVPKGLIYGEEALKTWLYDGNPIDVYEYSKQINLIKEKYKEGYFEDIIKRYILSNNHSSFVILKPDKKLSEKKMKQEKEELAKIKKEMSEEELTKIVQNTNRLLELQDAVDKKEDLDKIPRLRIEDIKKETTWAELERREYDGHEVLYYPHATNEIMYITLKFSSKTVDQSLIPYITLLEGVFAELSTKNYSNEELSIKVDKNVGSIRFSSRTVININTPDEYEPQLLVESKGLVSKTKEMIELVNEIMNNTLFEESSRIHEIIKMARSKIKSSIIGNGHSVVADKLLTYFMEAAKYGEQASGLGFYTFLIDLDENFDKKEKEIKENLKKVRDIIFNKKYMSMLVVCDEKDYKTFEDNISIVLNNIKTTEKDKINYSFNMEKEKLGLTTQADVQYVAKGYNLKKLGYEATGSLMVLNGLLRYDYLWNEVRVKGGAYGCMVFSSLIGNFVVASYRDPNLKETINVYNHISDYLEKLDIPYDEIEKYIVSTIGEIDKPYATPYRKAYSIESKLSSGITKEFEQKIRAEVINTKLEDVKKFAGLIKSLMEQDYICVLGNEAKLKENADIFDKIERVE